MMESLALDSQLENLVSNESYMEVHERDVGFTIVHFDIVNCPSILETLYARMRVCHAPHQF